ncbi:MAG TPA: transcriptional regulator [Clostridiales bacterium]|nr:transcriptional regulator [Clostridiales bacterium]
MNKQLCQSCGMPMLEENMFGKNADGSKNEDYCCYCYPNGAFSKDETMEEMIETCIPFMIEGGTCKDKEAARAMLMSILPNLKRWKNK